MVQDLEKLFQQNFEEDEKEAHEVLGRENESVFKKHVSNAKSLWTGYAEKSLEVDPNYKTYGYLKGLCVYLAFETMSVFFQGYLACAFLEQESKLEEIFEQEKTLDVAIMKGQIAEVIKNLEPVVVQAVCVAVFYVFFILSTFKYAERVLQHHGKVLTGGMNYYSLLAIFMPFYFVYQSIWLPITYAMFAWDAWDLKEIASSELANLVAQAV